jgi:hypothetical protein
LFVVHADHGDIVTQALDHALQGRQDQRMVIDEQDFHGGILS